MGMLGVHDSITPQVAQHARQLCVCVMFTALQVRRVFDDMYKAGLQPNIMTYVSLLSSYAELGWWRPALQILNHMCQPQVWTLLLPCKFEITSAIHMSGFFFCPANPQPYVPASGLNACH